MIKNIVLDLGAVILAIDLQAYIAELQRLAPNANFTFDHNKHRFYQDFEKGLISEDAFFAQMQEALQSNVAIEQLINAWQKILLKPYAESFEFLKWAKMHNYKLYLLSNTNAAHRKQFDQIFNKEWGQNEFYNFFEKVYYSYEMQKIKPNPDIFASVLINHNLLPNETFFVDDNAENVAAAKKLGINAWLFAGAQDWEAIKFFLQEKK